MMLAYLSHEIGIQDPLSSNHRNIYYNKLSCFSYLKINDLAGVNPYSLTKIIIYFNLALRILELILIVLNIIMMQLLQISDIDSLKKIIVLKL